MSYTVTLYRSPGAGASSASTDVPDIETEAEALAVAERMLAEADTQEPMTVEVRAPDGSLIFSVGSASRAVS